MAEAWETYLMEKQKEEKEKEKEKQGQQKTKNVDLRVALGHGKRTYGHVRISIIDNDKTAVNHSQPFNSFFDYNADFVYFWKEKFLHTGVKMLNAPTSSSGSTSSYYQNTFSIGEEPSLQVKISIPAPGGRTRGFVFADPCFSSKYVGCTYGDSWKTFETLTQLLNSVLPREDVDTWILIGDNFYDPKGELAPQFFGALSMEAKSKPLIAVAGNHDLWQHGTPTSSGIHTYGNGYMQYYMMDTSSTVQDSQVPLNFSVTPPKTEEDNHNEICYEEALSSFDAMVNQQENIGKIQQRLGVNPYLPPFEDFFSYNRIGNLGVMSFDGAHTFPEGENYFIDFCNWVGVQSPPLDWVFVLNHWSAINFGCQPHMDAKGVHHYLQSLPGCVGMANRIKWFEGHSHCNLIIENNTGFRVGGFGMGGCQNFGFPFFDTNFDGKNGLEVMYFPMLGGAGFVPYHEEDKNATASDHSFQELMTCFEKNGPLGCKQMGVSWLKQTRT